MRPPPLVREVVRKFLRVEGFAPYTFACTPCPPIRAGDWKTPAITRSGFSLPLNSSLWGVKRVSTVAAAVRESLGIFESLAV